MVRIKVFDMSNEHTNAQGQNTAGKRRLPNLGEVIFFAIFLYMAANLIAYATKTHYTFVEVEPGQIINSDTFQGIAIRDEKVVAASGSGTISYFVNDSEKTGKNGNVCVIESTSAADSSSAAADNFTLSSADYSDIREQIHRFYLNYNDSTYAEADTLSYRLGNIVNRIISSQHISSIQPGKSRNIRMMTAPEYGTVSYTIDGMESITAEDIQPESFNSTDYEKTQISAGTVIKQADPAYKLITSDNWQIIVDPDEDQLEKFKQHESVNVTFIRDNITAQADVSFLDKDGHTLVCLSLSNYMVRYCSERYLDISIVWEKHDGYKIPASSITTKAYYMLPKDFVVTAADTQERGIYIKGDNGPEFIKPRLYTKIEETDQIQTAAAQTEEEADETKAETQEETKAATDFYYIDADDIAQGTLVLKNDDSQETYTIAAQSELQGVYNINEGFADFYLIGKPYAYGDYCIIEKKPGLNLSLYDHIILDAESVYEGQVIY